MGLLGNTGSAKQRGAAGAMNVFCIGLIRRRSPGSLAMLTAIR
jgi:hypothetical protein